LQKLKLAIEANDRDLSIMGTVPLPKKYETIEPLAREIKGVQPVNVDFKVVPPSDY